MALFILFLILAIGIKASTIREYLRTAASLSKHAQLSYYTRKFEGKLANPIQRVLNEQKHWEDMPNRREPIKPIIIDDT